MYLALDPAPLKSTQVVHLFGKGGFGGFVSVLRAPGRDDEGVIGVGAGSAEEGATDTCVPDDLLCDGFPGCARSRKRSPWGTK